jgi:LDH2 family malate/lactate/ureidoglycolate dehydrogenase
VSTTVIRRYRLDDLRRFAAALCCASGLAPSRASALAAHLLWFDAAGAASYGIETLPYWLEKIESGSVDLTEPGTIKGERPSLVTIDGHNGIAPLVLQRAAELAVEKARDTAVALVRVTHLGGLGSAAAIVAGMAVRPMAGLVLGPARLWSVAMPSPAGLPFVFDSALAGIDLGRPATTAAARTIRHGGPARPRPPRSSPPLDGACDWTNVLVSGESWLVAAIALNDLEPLSVFHDRVGQWIGGLADGSGRLAPVSWTVRHHEAHERGVAVAPAVWKELKHWANRFRVAIPTPG